MSEPLHAGELRALLNDPGVQHLLPPNWKDRVVAQVDRLTEALETGKRCPQCSATEWNEASHQRTRAERAEADLADEKRRHGELRAGLADFYEHNADLVSEYWRIKVRALLDTATEEAQGAP